MSSSEPMTDPNQFYHAGTPAAATSSSSSTRYLTRKTYYEVMANIKKGPFHPASAPNGPSLPSLPGMGHSSTSFSPHHNSNQAHEQQVSSQQYQAPPAGYPLPSMNQAPPPGQMPQSGYDREREMQEARERDIRDRDYEARRQQRDQEARDRDMRDRQQREQHAPHQNHVDSLHLHQPVAVAPGSRSIHGPNGLLGNNGIPPQNNASTTVQNPPTPSQQPMYGPVYESGQPPPQPQAAQMAPQLLSFAPPQQQAPQQAQGQGQQPILNDALTYLDMVKVRFADDPRVYNQFLDIMKDFKSQTIDTPGVINRVSMLFKGHPELIKGFNTFLPPGYRIDITDDRIRVTTPEGHTLSPLGNSLLPLTSPAHGDVPHMYDHRGSHPGFAPIQAPRPMEGLPSPNAHFGRANLSPSFYEAEQREQEAIAREQQRGATSLQNVASAAAAEPRANTILPGASPSAENAALSTQQQNMEKRGPVEFNHAISYVNKIKNRFHEQPEIYKQFLEILQTYQRESRPIQDVYAQVQHLFEGAQDLLQDFKQFLPESAASSKAQESRQADDLARPSNVRSELGYPGQMHTPRPERTGANATYRQLCAHAKCWSC